jgi:signal transduction histidine kinase
MLAPNHSLPTDGTVTDLPHRTATAHQQQDAPARLHLLLIGDEDASADVLAGMLDHQGYAVERVVSRQDALTQFLTPDADGFDVVLTIPLAPGAPSAWLDELAELRDVNEQLLIAGLREQELGAALEAERAQLAVILAGIGDEARAEREAALQVAHRGEQECAQLLMRAEEAEGAVQVRDDYLSAASHDLRTPLTSIMARAQLLLGRLDHEDALAPEFARLHLTALLQATRRMRAMVGEITEATHLQSGQTLALDLAPMDLGEMVQTVVQDVAETNAAREVSPEVSPVVVRVAADVLVPGDRPRLERVVQNIVENALKYSRDAVPVHVEVEQQDEWAVLTVRDHGVGIPTDELAHIFTPFYRASTAKGITGTGLGLARTRSVVTQHGGQISLESAVGWGTSVTVCLPLCGR